MRFIAYGCSYTQGAELADDWLSGKHHNTIDKEKRETSVHKFYKRYTKGMRKGMFDPEYIRKMNDRSYAGEIARTLKVDEYINRGAAGNTNKAMFLDVAQDIQSGFIKKDDIIFVGLTSSDRYTWFQNGRTHHGQAGGGSWPNETVKKVIIGTWTDDDFSYETILAVRALRDLLQDYKFFYQTVHFPFSDMQYKTSLTESVLKELMDIDKRSVIAGYSIWREIALNTDLPDPPQHGYEHPKVEVATAFGRNVGNAIRVKLGLKDDG